MKTHKTTIEMINFLLSNYFPNDIKVHLGQLPQIKFT